MKFMFCQNLELGQPGFLKTGAFDENLKFSVAGKLQNAPKTAVVWWYQCIREVILSLCGGISVGVK